MVPLLCPGAFTADELLKLWKGLFYCLWMQDKPLLQVRRRLLAKRCADMESTVDTKDPTEMDGNLETFEKKDTRTFGVRLSDPRTDCVSLVPPPPRRTCPGRSPASSTASRAPMDVRAIVLILCSFIVKRATHEPVLWVVCVRRAALHGELPADHQERVDRHRPAAHGQVLPGDPLTFCSSTPVLDFWMSESTWSRPYGPPDSVWTPDSTSPPGSDRLVRASWSNTTHPSVLSTLSCAVGVFLQLVRFMFRQTFEMLKRTDWDSR